VSEATDVTTAAGESTPAAAGPASPLAPVAAGAAMVALGVLLLAQVPAIRAEGYSVQGPRFLPLVVISLWTVLSAVYLGQGLLALRKQRAALPAERFDHLGRVGLLLVLLVGYAYTVDPVGYVPTTTLFFIAATRILGSRHTSRDALVAVLLTCGVYLTFTEALNVRLPQGLMPF
jgi:putative tricarboxylic transport membrane protein